MSKKKKKAKPVFYDCEKCPAFCCGVYPRVRVEDSDVERMAMHYELTFAEAEKRFTKTVAGERLLRRKRDHLLGETCKFLVADKRGCTIYAARPEVCRIFPAKPRCAYYDLWQFEQEQQSNRGLIIPLVQITFPDEE